MRAIEKFQSLWILASVIAGLGLGQFEDLGSRAGLLVLPLLMVMLTGVFLHVPLSSFGAALKRFRFTGLSLGMNFIWTPAFGWLLGLIFLRDYPDLWVGLLMLLVTPCTDWYLVFTELARGDVRVAAALLPWHLALQLLLLPVYLLVLAGTIVQIELRVVAESILLVLGIPILAATFVRVWAERRMVRGWFEAVMLPRVASIQIVFLCLAIAAMFASQGTALVEQPGIMLRLMPPLLFFFGVNLVLGWSLGWLAGFSYPTRAGLTFATLARNSPVALAIAVSAFPARPLIAQALVIGPLIELPVMALIAGLLRSTQPRPRS